MSPAAQTPPSPAAQTQLPSSPQPIDPEPGPRTDVVITWRDSQDMTGKVLGSSALLFADLMNSLDRTVTGRLVLVTSGLDGRLVERPLQSFSLPVGLSLGVPIPVGRLAIQSEVSTSLAAVVAEVDRPQATLRVSTQPIY